ncbi:heterokaryon incompatibility protein, partial [Tothia fuscella]
MYPKQSVYENLPLDLSRKQIRLVQIEPGRPDDVLTCKLFCVALRQPACPFHALSYTWDQDPPTRTVKINETDFLVRRNLYSALVQLRHPSFPVRLWVDAICINQDSIVERNSQVPLMGDIYSSAAKVIFWLGEGNNTTDLALQALKRLVVLSQEPECTKTGMNDIFTRPWFDRTWTVQELASAEN